jgi:ABC-2 type transport system permease protein
MNNTFLIAKREYLEQIKGRAFKMTTVGLPTVFALIVGVAYLSSLGIGANKHLAVAGNDAALADQIRTRLLADNDNKATVDVVAPASSADRDRLIDKVKSKSLDGLLWIDSPAGALPTANYISTASGDFITTARLKDAVNNGLLDEHLVASGMKQADADAVVKGITLDTFQIKKDGSVVKSNAAASFWKGYVMAILLSMTTMIYGMNVARSIIQEKTSRIFEVMLSTAKPSDMLAGKLIGVGAVGLTQIGIWLITGTAIFISPFAAALMTGDFVIHFSWAEGILFPVYFLLGYLRDRAGTADVHAPGRRTHMAQLRHDHAHHQRLQLHLVHAGLVLPTHRAHRHVPAYGLGSAAVMAVRRFNLADVDHHLGHALVLLAPLPRRHSHVWQARYAA